MTYCKHIYLVKTVCHMQECVPPCYPFELSPLNDLNRGKLVSSISLIPLDII